MVKEQHTSVEEISDWPFRIHHPENSTSGTKLMILLHGYQGNENVMWVLTKPLPKNYYLLSPRAPLETGDGQFSWHEITAQWPSIETYQELSHQLLSRVDQWVADHAIGVNNYDVMGFSQGAVMGIALAAFYPNRIGRVAALSGFIPQTWQNQINLSALSGKAFYIAHGTKDEIVPVKKAHQAVEMLEKHGADVTFCEADIGHKLSASCFKGLGSFFA